MGTVEKKITSLKKIVIPNPSRDLWPIELQSFRHRFLDSALRAPLGMTTWEGRFG